MSNLYRRSTSSLAGIDLSKATEEDLRALVRSILEAGIHGVCFSPYVEGQGPGTELEESQIRERLEIINCATASRSLIVGTPASLQSATRCCCAVTSRSPS